MDFPQYDELHVVSDLHMGGAPGFQILKEGKRLSRFIDWVGEQRPGQRVALVLNGDVIDSLAENVTGYIAVDESATMMSRIFKDPSFAPVWDALAGFVAKDGRTLVFVLGNHDVEIALPNVQRLIVEHLAGDKLEARARIEFSTMGAGFSCYVGAARVFCTHGNEVDPWNYIRYEDLAKAARRINSGRSLDVSEWEPNAGTKMVKDIMNGVKKKYAWIDLLKPETKAAVGVLMVLDPAQVKNFRNILPVVGEKIKGSAQIDQRLSADGFNTTTKRAAEAPAVDALLGSNLAQGIKLGSRSGESADDMLRASEDALDSNTARTGSPNETLGTGQVLWDRLTGWLTGVPQDEALRRALKDWLEGDQTFELSNEDETCNAILPTVNRNVDFVVTGHTHLARAITMGPGRFYFNCGTWIRLLRFTDAMLKDTSTFKPIFEMLASGSMDAIDGAYFANEPLVMDRATAVSIVATPAGVTGELARVLDTTPISRDILQSFTKH